MNFLCVLQLISECEFTSMGSRMSQRMAINAESYKRLSTYRCSICIIRYPSCTCWRYTYQIFTVFNVTLQVARFVHISVDYCWGCFYAQQKHVEREEGLEVGGGEGRGKRLTGKWEGIYFARKLPEMFYEKFALPSSFTTFFRQPSLVFYATEKKFLSHLNSFFLFFFFYGYRTAYVIRKWGNKVNG